MNWDSELKKLRAEIDSVDEALIEALHLRMEVVKRIGEIKKKASMAPEQPGRWQEVMKNRLDLAKKKGLSTALVTEIFDCIHKEGIKLQK